VVGGEGGVNERARKEADLLQTPKRGHGVCVAKSTGDGDENGERRTVRAVGQVELEQRQSIADGSGRQVADGAVEGRVERDDPG